MITHTKPRHMNSKTIGVVLLTAFLFITLSSATTKKNSWNIKKFEKNLVEVLPTSKTYCYNKEVSNMEYRTFLQDLKNTGKDDLFKSCNYDSLQWRTQPMINIYHWHPAYNQYPVVNITHEAAIAYCNWLSKKYNTNNDREFKKVLFYLPRETDWIYAANAFTDGKLPWYGDKPYDFEGNYLANIKHRYIGQVNGRILGDSDSKQKDVEEAPKKEFEVKIGVMNNYMCDDGFHTLINAHYPANRIGVYDIIGNVAEMTGIKGIAKGGHWNSYIEDCFVDRHQKHEGPSPLIGFRVFMQVIEE